MKILAPMAFAAAVALTTVALAGAAMAQPAPHPPAKTGNYCFWKRNIENFVAPNTSTLYVRVGVNDIYEFKMFPGCFELDWVYHLGVRTYGSSEICTGPNPNVEVFTREAGMGRQRCPVTSVRRLSPAQVAALPKSARP